MTLSYATRKFSVTVLALAFLFGVYSFHLLTYQHICTYRTDRQRERGVGQRQMCKVDTSLLQSTFLKHHNNHKELPESCNPNHMGQRGTSQKDIPGLFVFLLNSCLMHQQHAAAFQGEICHTEAEAADQTDYFTQSQYTDTGPTSPTIDPVTQGAWQGSHWSTSC